MTIDKSDLFDYSMYAFVIVSWILMWILLLGGWIDG